MELYFIILIIIGIIGCVFASQLDDHFHGQGRLQKVITVFGGGVIVISIIGLIASMIP